MTCTNEITHLGLEGTHGLGDGRLGGSCLLGLNRPGTSTALQTPSRGGGSGHDGGGDRKGEANDGQGELHDSILGGTKETMGEGVTVCISLRRNEITLSAMRWRRAAGTDTVDMGRTFESSGEEKRQNVSIEMLLLNMDL